MIMNLLLDTVCLPLKSMSNSQDERTLIVFKNPVPFHSNAISFLPAFYLRAPPPQIIPLLSSREIQIIQSGCDQPPSQSEGWPIIGFHVSLLFFNVFVLFFKSSYLLCFYFFNYKTMFELSIIS